MTHSFKPLAAIAFQKWTQEQCEWIAKTARPGDIAKKVAEYVLKKKYDQTRKVTIPVKYKK